MHDFLQLPKDMVSEILQNLSYAETIKLCQTDSRFFNYCKTNRALVNEKLLTEAMNASGGNLDGALSYVVQHNNTAVVKELLISGAKPYSVRVHPRNYPLSINAPSRPNRSEVMSRAHIYTTVGDAIKNGNKDIIRSFIGSINYDSDLTQDEKEYLTSYIINDTFAGNLIDDYLIDKYPQYITPYMIYKTIEAGYPIHESIYENVDKYILKEGSKDVGIEFFPTIILYTLAYQPAALLDLLKYSIINNEFDLEDPNIGPDIADILKDRQPLFNDLAEQFNITIGRAPKQAREELTGAILRRIRTLIVPDQPYSPTQPSKVQLAQNRLNQLTIADLKDLALSIGIRVPSKFRKPEIIALLTESQVNVPLTENLTPYKLRQMAEILKLPTTLEMDKEHLLSLVRSVICPS